MNIKMMWKKVILTATAALTIGGASFAATPAETYAEAAQNTITKTAGEYVFNMDMSMPLIGSITANGTLDMQTLPSIKGKGTIQVNVAGKAVSPSTVYVEQEGKNVTSYYSVTNEGKTTWKKQTQQLKSEHAVADYIKDKHNVLAGVKSVTAAGNNTYQVVFDSSKIYSKDTIENIKIKYGANEKAVNLTEKVLQALQQAGDVTTIVTIDPATKEITKVEFPMTPQLRQVALAVLDNANTTDANQAVIRQFIMNSNITLAVELKPLPAGIDFTIPQDIKNQAVASNK